MSGWIDIAQPKRCVVDEGEIEYVHEPVRFAALETTQVKGIQ